MPKITVKAGITLPLGTDERGKFSFFRGDVEFADIDTSEPLNAQLEECAEAVDATAKVVEESLAKQASNLSGMNVEGVGLATEFEEFRKRLRVAFEDLSASVEKHDNILQAAEASGILKIESEPEEKKPRRKKRSSK